MAKSNNKHSISDYLKVYKKNKQWLGYKILFLLAEKSAE